CLRPPLDRLDISRREPCASRRNERFVRRRPRAAVAVNICSRRAHVDPSARNEIDSGRPKRSAPIAFFLPLGGPRTQGTLTSAPAGGRLGSVASYAGAHPRRTHHASELVRFLKKALDGSAACRL